MRAALEFLRNHWVSLLCGVVAAAALVFGIMGMTSDAVRKRMQSEILQRTHASSIANLKRNPKNDEIIAREKKRVELFDAEIKRTMEIARKINARDPLLPDVFPRPRQEVDRFRFREAYRDAMSQLPVRLHAGTLPTQAEIEEERLNVQDMLALEQEKTPGGAAVTTPGAGPVGRGVPAVGVAGGYRGPGLGTRLGTAPKYDPVLRARVSKARQIRCYVDEDSFHVSPIVDSSEAPSLLDMWLAQVGYWVQADLVSAIADFNDQAARTLGPDQVYVEFMPVKRLDQVQILGYQTKDGLKPFPTRTQTGTGMGRTMQQQAASSFTKRVCNELYDVVRLRLTVVADQREVLRLIDRISKQNFFTCVGASYEVVDRQREEQQEGYLYGSAPVIRVTLDYEFYMLRDVYQPLMPDPVLELLGIKKKP